MPRRPHQIYLDTSNIAALSQVESPAWIDLGKHSAPLEALKTSTTGTYALEVDWSRDANNVLTTDPVAISDSVAVTVPGKARWCKVRVKNTHATNAFSAHNTRVTRDAGTGTA